MKIAFYDSSLTDAQWTFLSPMIPAAKIRGRPRTNPRLILDAIFYVLKSGVQWRLLPSDFPPFKTVFHIFRKWKRDHTWEAINDRLRAYVRASEGKRCRPTAAILDSQTVKSASHGGETGYDAAKRIKGRKRHILVDTLGLLLGIVITPGDVTEREGAQDLLTETLPCFKWLRLLWADGGYSGSAFAQWVKNLRPKLKVEIVKRSDDVKGFEVLPRRWVVERTFAWFMSQRRLVRDYETTEASAAAWAYVAMIRIQLRRLA